MKEHPVKPLPNRSGGGKDTALQTQPLAITSATVSGVTGFNGVGLSGGYNISSEPPDTNGSVGATKYVQWVNTAFAIYDTDAGEITFHRVPYDLTTTQGRILMAQLPEKLALRLREGR